MNHDEIIKSEYLLQIYRIIGEVEYTNQQINVITKDIEKAYRNLCTAGESLGYNIKKIAFNKLIIKELPINIYSITDKVDKGTNYILDES